VNGDIILNKDIAWFVDRNEAFIKCFSVGNGCIPIALRVGIPSYYYQRRLNTIAVEGALYYLADVLPFPILLYYVVVPLLLWYSKTHFLALPVPRSNEHSSDHITFNHSVYPQCWCSRANVSRFCLTASVSFSRLLAC